MVTLMCIDFHISNYKSRFLKIQVTLMFTFHCGLLFSSESRFLQKGNRFFFNDLLKHMLIFIYKLMTYQFH
jgi:hypothetical protein